MCLFKFFAHNIEIPEQISLHRKKQIDCQSELTVQKSKLFYAKKSLRKKFSITVPRIVFLVYCCVSGNMN